MSRVAKTCRNLYKVKHKLEYPYHTVYQYMPLPIITQEKVCTTITEISQNPKRRGRQVVDKQRSTPLTPSVPRVGGLVFVEESKDEAVLRETDPVISPGGGTR